MKKTLKRLLCWFLGHAWTCNADKGIPPTQEQLENYITGFNEYSQMYCDRCGFTTKH